MKALILFLSFFFLGRVYSQITLIPTGSTDLLFYISKVNNNNIIVTGRDSYYSKSTDECNSLLPLLPPGPQTHYQILNRLSVNNSFMLSYNMPSNNSKIYNSLDDCNNWNLVMDSSIYLSNIKFFDANEGYGVSTFYKALRFKNGGSSRIVSSNPYTVPMMMEVYGDSIIALGGITSNGGSFSISKDRANTWYGGVGFNTMSEPRDIFFLNKDTLFAISSQGYWGPFFAKSFNGGVTWQKDTIAKNNPYGLYFKNANEGYILGQLPNGMGAIMKTTNIGQNWSTFNTQIPTTLLDMKFLNDSIALVSGSNGVLFKWNSKATQFITGVDDIYLEDNAFSVFPNPTSSKIKVQYSGIVKEGKIFITNSLGQVILNELLLDAVQEIDLSLLPAGVYFLSAQTINYRKVVKLVKE